MKFLSFNFTPSTPSKFNKNIPTSESTLVKRHRSHHPTEQGILENGADTRQTAQRQDVNKSSWGLGKLEWKMNFEMKTRQAQSRKKSI